jgi:hypothetical protein
MRQAGLFLFITAPSGERPVMPLTVTGFDVGDATFLRGAAVEEYMAKVIAGLLKLRAQALDRWIGQARGYVAGLAAEVAR